MDNRINAVVKHDFAAYTLGVIIQHTNYLGRYMPSSPSSKELHGTTNATSASSSSLSSRTGLSQNLSKLISESAVAASWWRRFLKRSSFLKNIPNFNWSQDCRNWESGSHARSYVAPPSLVPQLPHTSTLGNPPPFRIPFVPHLISHFVHTINNSNFGRFRIRPRAVYSIKTFTM